MKVAGIITEYNPFHNGHKYHVEETRRVTGCDYVIAVMSGNYVQRGTPALMDKYSRTMMALNNGVDIVLELPVCYSTASAEYFSTGAVSLLEHLGIVDYLCFGSECGNISLLKATAETLLENQWSAILQTYLQEGLSFPAAREKAVAKLYEDKGYVQASELSEVLSEPNNILGIEYLKAIIKLDSKIQPMTIRRQVAHYHDANLSNKSLDDVTSSDEDVLANVLVQNAVISSATAIRKSLYSMDDRIDFSELRHSIPEDVYELMKKQYGITYPITEEDFINLIQYKLLSLEKESLIDYMDINSDLADRIWNLRLQQQPFQEFTKALKTKNLTHTRINRALIHLLLDIRTMDIKEYMDNGITYYARVLGARKDATHLLRRITDSERIPVITKVAKAEKQLEGLGMKMLEKDLFASHLYNQIIYNKYGTPLTNEYKKGIILV